MAGIKFCFFSPGENGKWGQPGEIRWKVATLSKIPKKICPIVWLTFSPKKKRVFFSVFFYKKMEDELKKWREEMEGEMYIPLPHFPLGIKKCQNP